MREVICGICGETFRTNSGVKKYCGKECKVASVNELQNKRYYEKLTNIDRKEDSVVPCLICGKKFTSIVSHLNRTHGINSEQYREQFDGANVISNEFSEELSVKVKGDKNPAYQHGGKFSPWSPKSEYHSDEVKKEARKKAIENHTKDKRMVSLEYYTSRGMSLEEATIARSERQRTFTLDKCIEKHGDEEGRRIHTERQNKWHKSFKKTNYSKISQKLFWEIYGKCSHVFNSDDIYFATFDAGVECDTNKEYALKLSDKSIKPDFLVLSKKKIIEFDGDYWHGKRGNIQREAERDKSIMDDGYEILHVKEMDFVANNELVVQQCLEFLLNE